jgi:putative membrane protein
MMHHWDGGWGVGNWLLMSFGMLVFWAVVVAGIVWLVRYATTTTTRTAPGAPGVAMGKQPGPPPPSALEILAERYARGEINDEEYRSRRDTLAAR